MSDTEKPTTLAITAGYGRTIERLVRAGKYNFANGNITSQNFPTTREGVVQLKAVLVHFNRFIKSDDAVAELDKLKLRAGEIHELLAFGEQHPDEQRKYPILALGSIVKFGDYRYFPYLSGWSGRRKANLGWWGGRCRDSCRFLAFRKKGKAL